MSAHHMKIHDSQAMNSGCVMALGFRAKFILLLLVVVLWCHLANCTDSDTFACIIFSKMSRLMTCDLYVYCVFRM